MFKFYEIETFVNQASSIGVSLLVTIIGTLIGFLGAFFLSKREYRKQLIKENKQKIDIYKGRLKYLCQLIEISLIILDHQLDNFEELANDMMKNPTEQHLLKIKASNDLQRLQNMDTEEVFHAYHLVMPDCKNKIKDYKNIYGSIDFLYLRLKQAIESSEKRVGFTHKDQMYIKEFTDGLSESIFTKIRYLEGNGSTESSEYLFLVKSYNNYSKLIKDNANIEIYEKDFLIPFETELRKSFEGADFYNEFITMASKALFRFNHIKENSNQFATELRGMRKEMKNAIETLGKIKEKITCQLSK